MRWQDLVAKLTGKTPGPDAPGAVPPAEPGEPGKPVEPATPEEAADESAKPQPGEAAPIEAAPAQPAPTVEAMQMSQAQADPKPTAPAPGARSTKTDAVGRVYAQALLEMAESSGQVDTIADEVDQLEELLRSDASLRQLLETPAIGRDQRRDLIDRLFKSRVSDTTWRFLQVVNAKGRAGSLPNILATFQQLLAEKRGIVEVNLTVAQRLEAGEADQVAARIGQAIGKRVVLHQFVDEKLIGGMVIRIGDRVIDGSVATQLRNLRKQLVERGRDRARTQGASE